MRHKVPDNGAVLRITRVSANTQNSNETVYASENDEARKEMFGIVGHVFES